MTHNSDHTQHADWHDEQIWANSENSTDTRQNRQWESHSVQHQHYTSSASVQRVSENKGSTCRGSIGVMLQMPPGGGWTGARWSWSTGHGAHCHTFGHTGRVVTVRFVLSDRSVRSIWLMHTCYIVWSVSHVDTWYLWEYANARRYFNGNRCVFIVHQTTTSSDDSNHQLWL